MNKLATRKKSVINNLSEHCGKRKQGRRPQKTLNCPITKKYNEERRSKLRVKKLVKKANFQKECTENEASRGEIYNDKTVNLKQTASNESVVYLGTYALERTASDSGEMIDLTAKGSNESLEDKENVLPCRMLKTLYFSDKNFNRHFRFGKSLVTTSLITLPIVPKPDTCRKLNSAIDLSIADKKKLAVLELNNWELDPPEIGCADLNLSKADLNDTDYRIIDYILEQDELDLCSNASFHEDPLLDAGLSMDHIMETYGVTPDGEFD